ncbi:kinase-like protein, partial [Hanseniaspora valbyensis NRRL Y-1626]
MFPEQFLNKLKKCEYDENILKFLNYLNDDYFVAIKIIDLEETDDDIDILCQEIQFLTTLQSERKDHQNIVKYFKTFINGEKMWIVMEYCGGGSVYDLIKNLPMKLTDKIKMEHLSEPQISHIVSEVINGLLILHEKGSVHRDIKLANILLTKDGQIKLSDFGVSGKLNNTLKKRETFVGTPYWMAPEVILNGYKNSKTGVKQQGYDEKADIWSLGITIIELVNKKPPLIEHEPMQIVSKIPDLDPPTLKNNESWKCSKYLISFVDACLKKNPEDRLNGNGLLQLKFIKKYE